MNYTGPGPFAGGKPSKSKSEPKPSEPNYVQPKGLKTLSAKKVAQILDSSINTDKGNPLMYGTRTEQLKKMARICQSRGTEFMKDVTAEYKKLDDRGLRRALIRDTSGDEEDVSVNAFGFATEGNIGNTYQEKHAEDNGFLKDDHQVPNFEAYGFDGTEQEDEYDEGKTEGWKYDSDDDDADEDGKPDILQDEKSVYDESVNKVKSPQQERLEEEKKEKAAKDKPESPADREQRINEEQTPTAPAAPAATEKPEDRQPTKSEAKRRRNESVVGPGETRKVNPIDGSMEPNRQRISADNDATMDQQQEEREAKRERRRTETNLMANDTLQDILDSVNTGSSSNGINVNETHSSMDAVRKYLEGIDTVDQLTRAQRKKLEAWHEHNQKAIPEKPKFDGYTEDGVITQPVAPETGDPRFNYQGPEMDEVFPPQKPNPKMSSAAEIEAYERDQKVRNNLIVPGQGGDSSEAGGAIPPGFNSEAEYMASMQDKGKGGGASAPDFDAPEPGEGPGPVGEKGPEGVAGGPLPNGPQAITDNGSLVDPTGKMIHDTTAKGNDPFVEEKPAGFDGEGVTGRPLEEPAPAPVNEPDEFDKAGARRRASLPNFRDELKQSGSMSNPIPAKKPTIEDPAPAPVAEAPVAEAPAPAPAPAEAPTASVGDAFENPAAPNYIGGTPPRTPVGDAFSSPPPAAPAPTVDAPAPAPTMDEIGREIGAIQDPPVGTDTVLRNDGKTDVSPPSPVASVGGVSVNPQIPQPNQAEVDARISGAMGPTDRNAAIEAAPPPMVRTPSVDEPAPSAPPIPPITDPTAGMPALPPKPEQVPFTNPPQGGVSPADNPYASPTAQFVDDTLTQEEMDKSTFSQEEMDESLVPQSDLQAGMDKAKRDGRAINDAEIAAEEAGERARIGIGRELTEPTQAPSLTNPDKMVYHNEGLVREKTDPDGNKRHRSAHGEQMMPHYDSNGQLLGYTAIDPNMKPGHRATVDPMSGGGITDSVRMADAYKNNGLSNLDLKRDMLKMSRMGQAERDAFYRNKMANVQGLNVHQSEYSKNLRDPNWNPFAITPSSITEQTGYSNLAESRRMLDDHRNHPGHNLPTPEALAEKRLAKQGIYRPGSRMDRRTLGFNDHEINIMEQAELKNKKQKQQGPRLLNAFG